MFATAYFNHRARYFPMFEDARNRARLGKIKSIMNGRSHRLMKLEDLTQGATVINYHHLGTQTVSIDCIQGTTGRNTDFDRDFNPLKSNTRDRWINVASAYLQDIGLPAIDLLKVGDTYFVRDGHHRISVARALGTNYIDANVVVMEITK